MVVTTIDRPRAVWARVSLLLGSTLLVAIFAVSFMSAFGLLLRGSVSGYVLFGAVAVGALWAWYGARTCFAPQAGRVWALVMAVVVGIVIIAAAASTQFYDLSSDGQTYHQHAIARLAQGWNPVYETSGTGDPRLDHYVFGPWLPPAALYRLTGELESAKLFNAILALSAFLIAGGVFLARPDMMAWHAILVALAVTLNPVIVTQTLSFMVDGQVASLITVIVCSSIAVVDQLRGQAWWIVLYAAVAMLIAAKLSGLVYAIILLGVLLIWFGVYQRGHLLRLACGSVATVALGVIVMGTPLVSNTFHKGHPFFPAVGTPIMNGQMPPNFTEQSALENLVISLFSESQLGTDPTRRKLPYTFTSRELARFVHPDLRVSGFGPLFGGAMLLTIVAIVIGTMVWRTRTPTAKFIYLLAMVILGSVVFNPVGWWARFAPQLWLVPVLMAVYCGGLASRLGQWLGVVLLAVVLANGLLVCITYWPHQYRWSHTYAQQLAHIAHASESTRVKAYLSNFYAAQLRFGARGIRYEAVPIPPTCPAPIALIQSEVVVCP